MKDTPFVRGAARLKQRINTIRTTLAVPPLIDEIKVLLLRRTQDRFRRGVTPDNVPWQPLAAATLARKKYLGYGKEQALVRTGSMRDAIGIIRGGEGSTYSNTGAGFRIGIQNPEIALYARIQNKGTKRIPARRFLGIGASDIRAVDGILRRKANQLNNL